MTGEQMTAAEPRIADCSGVQAPKGAVVSDHVEACFETSLAQNSPFTSTAYGFGIEGKLSKSEVFKGL